MFCSHEPVFRTLRLVVPLPLLATLFFASFDQSDQGSGNRRSPVWGCLLLQSLQNVANMTHKHAIESSTVYAFVTVYVSVRFQWQAAC